MNGKDVKHRSIADQPPVEAVPGVKRRTLCYDGQIMLCHFTMDEDAKIPLHHHPAAQSGYLIRGHVQFFREDGSTLDVRPGDGYLFASNEPHGSQALEPSEIIECFTPSRPEYAD